MSALDLFNAVEELWIVAESPCNRSQAADMLGMVPTGVVPAAVGMGNEGDGHAARCFLSHRLSPALYEKKNRAVTNSGGVETHALIENLEAVQPHDILIRIDANRIQYMECGSLGRNHRLRRRCIEANGIPKLRNLDTKVEYRLAA